MNLDYSEAGKVTITMIPYIQKMLAELPACMDGTAPTPAGDNLFSVRSDNERELLDTDRSELYHHYTAKLLFLSQRARPDVLLPVSFLTTRVKAPDEDDYRKLARCMRYLRTTVELPLTLEADSLHEIKWYADGSYAVHSDMKSHTGATMTFGKGAAYSLSKKHKLNTKSSTEAEVVSADDVMGQLLWTRYFMEGQGYRPKKNLLAQDNESAMRLEKNGRASSTKRTKHINVRFFFIADRVQQGELTIVYCPTGEMWGDFFTKPLQGKKFTYFRDLIMNHKSTEDTE